MNEDEIISRINQIRELKDNTIGIVNGLGNNPIKLSTDLAYTNLVLAEAIYMKMLSDIERK